MADKEDERDGRLAKALRENLKRRKAYPRERPAPPSQGDTAND